MDLSLVQYLGFLVAALILVWAVIVINRRYFSRGNRGGQKRTTWINLDIQRTEEGEETLPGHEEEAQEERDEPDIRARAKQNGHYSQSKKLL